MGGLPESSRVCTRFLIKFSGYFNHKCACHNSEGSVKIDNNQILPAKTTENAKKLKMLTLISLRDNLWNSLENLCRVIFGNPKYYLCKIGSSKNYKFAILLISFSTFICWYHILVPSPWNLRFCKQHTNEPANSVFYILKLPLSTYSSSLLEHVIFRVLYPFLTEQFPVLCFKVTSFQQQKAIEMFVKYSPNISFQFYEVEWNRTHELHARKARRCENTNTSRHLIFSSDILLS